MKLTMNINDGTIEEPQLILKNIIGTPYFSDLESGNIIRPGGLARILTIWDFTTDLTVPQPYNTNESYSYDEYGVFDGINYEVLPVVEDYKLAQIPESFPTVYIPTGFIIESGKHLSRDLNDANGGTGLYLGLKWDNIGYPDPNSCMYLKFTRLSDSVPIIFYVYRGSSIGTRSAIEIKNYQIPGNTIVPVSLPEMFNNFDYIDDSLNNPANVIASLGFIVNLYQNLYGEISPEKFVKVYILNNDYDSYYPNEVEVPRLTCMGEPVIYGRSFNYNQITSGNLLLNTQGLNIGDSYVLNIGIEGLTTLRIYCTIT